ncbi:MAG: divalent cation tolerance protein CutA [Caulobacterales bacterium]
MDPVTLYSTWPNQEAAEACAALLIEAGAAACVTLLPGARSIYRWKGEVQRDAEVIMLVKTAAADTARALILAHHPYDLPAIAAWPIAANLSHAPYLAWIVAESGG